MAYATPPTKILGDSAPASDWNTYVKINFAHFADDHDHGSATNGALTLGGTGGLISAQFTDAAAPAAPGADKTVLFSVSGKGGQRAGAAGPAEEFSVTTHTHIQAEGAGQSSLSPTIAANSVSYSNAGETLTQTPSDSTGSPQFGMCIVATTRFTNANGQAGTVFLNLEVDSSQVEETSVAMAAPISTIVDLGIQHLEIAGAVSSTVYTMDVKKSGSTNVNGTIATLSLLEIQCL